MIETIAAVLLLAVGTTGEQLLESLRECPQIEDDLARLECFDEVLEMWADRGIDGDGSAETESSNRSWTVDSGTDPAGEATTAGGDPTTAVVRIPAEPGKRGRHQSIELFVSCQGGAKSVYIDWGQYLASDAPSVTVRIDSLPPSTSPWARSEDKRASSFRPRGTKKARRQKIDAFVRELMAGQRLAARVIPRGGKAVTALFDLSGAKEDLREVHKACRVRAW